MINEMRHIHAVARVARTLNAVKACMCDGLGVGRTPRIRRRRAQDVADTTDSLRAVACIRFVRLWLAGGVSAVFHDEALESIQDWME